AAKMLERAVGDRGWPLILDRGGVLRVGSFDAGEGIAPLELTIDEIVVALVTHRQERAGNVLDVEGFETDVVEFVFLAVADRAPWIVFDAVDPGVLVVHRHPRVPEQG